MLKKIKRNRNRDFLEVNSELNLNIDGRWSDNVLLSVVSNHINYYPTPINITYFWSFGSLAGLALVIQILSGVFLAMHYTPEVTLAFLSVEHIMRDVPEGFLLRYIHANGASMFFLIVYLHMFRGLYYGSYAYPLDIDSKVNKLNFYPYFYVKDLTAFYCFIALFAFFVLYFPNSLGHPDNYIEADALVTPAHIVPEWYFLPYYAILRSIPNKLGGVIAMGLSLGCLFLVAIITNTNVRNCKFRFLQQKLFWVIFADFLILGWIGQKEVETPYIEIGQKSHYVLFFLFFNINSFYRRTLYKTYNKLKCLVT